LQARARAEWWFSLLALLPALAIGCVYAEAFLASRSLGHWPTPSIEDPKNLPTAPLHVVSAILVLSVLPGAVVFAAVSVKNWRVLRKPSAYWVWVAALALSLSLYLWAGHVDPRTWEWWWD